MSKGKRRRKSVKSNVVRKRFRTEPNGELIDIRVKKILEVVDSFESHGDITYLIYKIFNINWVKKDNEDSTTILLNDIIQKRIKKHKSHNPLGTNRKVFYK